MGLILGVMLGMIDGWLASYNATLNQETYCKEIEVEDNKKSPLEGCLPDVTKASSWWSHLGNIISDR